MRLQRLSPATWGITELSDFELFLLREIPAAADPADSERARRRLFPSPINPEDDPEGAFCEDWSDYVAEGLADKFKSDLQILEDDLSLFQAYAIAIPVEEGEEETEPELPLEEALDEEEEGGNAERLYRAEFPDLHAGSWLGALNQARLMLAEKYNLHPEAHNGTLPQSMDPEEVLLAEEEAPDLAEIEHRWRANLQGQFYGMLQEWLISRVLSGEGSDTPDNEGWGNEGEEE